MILNLRQLEIFRALMLARSIGGAAELLHVSQPGISRALKHMETKLRITLFERRPIGLVATPEAEDLFREVEPLYTRAERIKYCIDRIVRAETSVVQIGCAPSLAHYVLPEILFRTKKDIPNLAAGIDTLSNEQLANYIVARQGDFALSTYDPVHPLVEAERTVSGRIRCVVPKTHKLASMENVHIREALCYDVISYYDDTHIGHVLNKCFRELGLKPRTSIRVRFNDDACAMVEHGLGVGFVYDFATTQNLSPHLRVIPLADNLPPIYVYLLRHRSHPFSNFVRRVYRSVSSNLAELPAF